MLLLFTGCNQKTQSGNEHSPSPSPSPSPSTSSYFPAFTDWRAAYLDENNAVHAITLDGKTDIIGPLLPHMPQTGFVICMGMINPDGHTLSYGSPSLNIIDLANKSNPAYYVKVAPIYRSIWSPNGNKLAVTDNGGTFWISDSKGTKPIVVPGSPLKGTITMEGWIDETHILMSGSGGLVKTSNGEEYPTIFYLSALDINTGKLSPIATIHNDGLGAVYVVISPDGKQALIANHKNRFYPFTPMVDKIDLNTGTITSLPGITKSTGAQFTTLAWKAGTQSVAVSTGFFVNHDLKTWILDLQTDRATHILDDQYVERWSPDNAVLIVSTGLDSSIGEGPYTLSAVTFASDGHASMTKLTDKAMSTPFVGFIRTSP
jgi:hypothetical protein